MTAVLRAGLVLCLAASPLRAENEELLKELKKQWSSFDRSKKIGALMNLEANPAPGTLTQANRWLKDKDPVVRAQVVRLVTGLARDEKLRAESERTVREYVQRHLRWRAKMEQREFDAVCRKHGKKVPPANEIRAGRDWKDPYDEERRELPEEIRVERVHMRGVVAAIEATGSKSYLRTLMRIYAEHHDPEVVLRVVGCLQAWKEWRALPPLADLLRIQEWGREVGGGDVIGNQRWAEMRLKWDVHKDRLWWSRPEYMPRAIKPICAAASAIVGTQVTSASELDGWLLAHEAQLRAHGVTLTAKFRQRARSTQR